VLIINKEQALAEFKQYSGFNSALNSLSKNPLPIVLQVLPQEALEETNTLINDMQHFAEVEFVQSDTLWLNRLHGIIQLVKQINYVITGLLLFVVLFIIAHTIRLQLSACADELILKQRIGAEISFMRRPFLYSGFCFGFIASILAWIIITIMLLLLREPIMALAQLYQNAFQLIFFNISEICFFVFLSSLLAMLSAWAVSTHYLHHIPLK
jgi:cell division transport system permease protein